MSTAPCYREQNPHGPAAFVLRDAAEATWDEQVGHRTGVPSSASFRDHQQPPVATIAHPPTTPLVTEKREQG